MPPAASLARPPAAVLVVQVRPGPGRDGVSPGALMAPAYLERSLRGAATRIWAWRTRRGRMPAAAIEQARLLVAPVSGAPYTFELVCPRVERAQAALPGLQAPDLVVEAFGQAAVFLVRALANPSRASLVTGGHFRLAQLTRSLCGRLAEGEAMELSVPDGTSCRLDRASGELLPAWPTARRQARGPRPEPLDEGGETQLGLLDPT